jgi:hypothetical protein
MNVIQKRMTAHSNPVNGSLMAAHAPNGAMRLEGGFDLVDDTVQQWRQVGKFGYRIILIGARK